MNRLPFRPGGLPLPKIPWKSLDSLEGPWVALDSLEGCRPLSPPPDSGWFSFLRGAYRAPASQPMDGDHDADDDDDDDSVEGSADIDHESDNDNDNDDHNDYDGSNDDDDDTSDDGDGVKVQAQDGDEQGQGRRIVSPMDAGCGERQQGGARCFRRGVGAAGHRDTGGGVHEMRGQPANCAHIIAWARVCLR